VEQSLSHTKWESKYQYCVDTEVPQEGVIQGVARGVGSGIAGSLARQRESKIEEGHLLVDHVHILISIPPKHAVSQVVGYLKGKSAIWVARHYGRKRNFSGQHFWARGYYVSTVGRDEVAIRAYIRQQESEDRRQDQLGLFG